MWTLDRAIPLYEEMPGWSEDISEIDSFVELPVNAQKYIARIADLVETPICIVSVGRRRDQAVILDPEMLEM